MFGPLHRRRVSDGSQEASGVPTAAAATAGEQPAQPADRGEPRRGSPHSQRSHSSTLQCSHADRPGTSTHDAPKQLNFRLVVSVIEGARW